MIRRAILGVMAKLSDHHVDQPIIEIAKTCRKNLEKQGLSGQVLGVLDNHEELNRVFAARLVPNPRFWRQQGRQRIAFFAVETPSHGYGELLDTLGEFPNVSHYVCYGDVDVLVRAAGTDAELDRLEEYLNKGRFVARRHMVEDAPVFYGFVTEKVETRKSEISEEEMDLALAAPAHSVPEATRKALEECGAILGTVYHEDHRSSGRVRAFIGVQLRDALRPADRRRFEEALTKINPREIDAFFSEPLVSVYRCSSPKFGYLVQLICDDQGQLDRLTDEIQELSEVVWNTVTMVVAKNEERPFLYSASSAEQADAQVAASQMSDQRVLPLLQALRSSSPEMPPLFDSAGPAQQLTAVSLYGEFVEPDGELLPACFEPFALDLIRGVLRDRAPDIKNAGQALVRECVEPAHLEVAKLLSRDVLGGTDEYWHSELKQSDAQYWKWGLGVWGEYVYPHWNKHDLFGKLMLVPDSVLWSFKAVGQMRNRFSHARPEAGNRDLLQAAREAFAHSAIVYRWSRAAVKTLADPAIRFAAVRESILGSRSRNAGKILAKLDSFQEQLLAVLAEHRNAVEPRVRDLADAVLQIGAGKLDLTPDSLDELEKRMLQVLDASRQEEAKSGFAYLRQALRDLPPGVAASVLASMLSGALGLG